MFHSVFYRRIVFVEFARRSFLFFTLVLLSCSFRFTSAQDCPQGWVILNPETGKCARFFDHKVNYTQADYICRNIADGKILAVESREEQRALVAYLIGLISMSRSPVAWIGAKVSPPNKIYYNDGSAAKYTNFGGEEIHTDEEKCVKIFSILTKNDFSDHGMWSLDGCSYSDAGFVCQKQATGSSRTRVLSDSPYSSDQGEASTKFLLDQFKDQLTMIKEICESHMKAIERLSNNQLYMLQHYGKSKGHSK